MLHAMADAFVSISVDSRRVKTGSGYTVAAALLEIDHVQFRRTSRFSTGRSLFCGIGSCFDCVVKIDGISNRRACITEVQEGMIIETQDGDAQLVPSRE
ncbi:(2Fe-2S)-binding protein [Roseobacter weihaiensis]|uniref:(2Fe-2S)-binding protein n=1 Tax=Roseobacter weihaiensis TaxID=2763262 RepID=UPI00387331DB